VDVVLVVHPTAIVIIRLATTMHASNLLFKIRTPFNIIWRKCRNNGTA
jgi:predicted P-loop ATPase/GTPase